ncbi:unnamed protein product [Brassicogethes aeneus]|uniref:Uncharacterized protein n=1 Tax=Brassicogethes aeneus TaxID=1431903 RepID=A0A9P0FI48_BRAAE|nr:unnamed protein product [Brassicogethes aeneus]
MRLLAKVNIRKVFQMRVPLYLTLFMTSLVPLMITAAGTDNIDIWYKAKPFQMNDVSRMGSSISNEKALKLGMSTLHVPIKFMEYILHLNLDFAASGNTFFERKNVFKSSFLRK